MTTKVKSKQRTLRVPLPASVSGLFSRHHVCEALGGCSMRKLDQMIASGEFPRANGSLGRNPRWTVALFNA